MRILVTGGAGYIGSLTSRTLADAGHGIVVLDDLRRGHRAAVGELPLVVGDATDTGLVADVLDRHAIEAVIHFAACKSVEESVADPGLYFRNNIGSTVAVLQAMARSGIRSIVFSSTCAVYGRPDVLPVDEDAPVRPMNPYGESKLLSERLLPWFEDAHGIRAAVLRYFNAAGAAVDGSIGEDWEGAENLIPIVMQVAADRRAVLDVHGVDLPTPDGSAVRDYIHVLDLADAHARALDVLVARQRSFTVNVGTGHGASVHEVVDLARRVTGRPIPTVPGSPRAGDPPAVWADTRRAESTLGWRPTRSLEDIITSAWAWHSRHPEGHSSVDDVAATPRATA